MNSNCQLLVMVDFKDNYFLRNNFLLVKYPPYIKAGVDGVPKHLQKSYTSIFAVCAMHLLDLLNFTVLTSHEIQYVCSKCEWF